MTDLLGWQIGEEELTLKLGCHPQKIFPNGRSEPLFKTGKPYNLPSRLKYLRQEVVADSK